MRHASRIAVLAGGEPWGTSGPRHDSHVRERCDDNNASRTLRDRKVPVRVERTYGGSGHRATKGDDVLYRDLHLARAECRPARIWAFDSYEAIKRAVADGAGVSFVSRLLVREEIGRGELAPFRIAGVERMVRPIHVVQPSLTELTRQAAAFLSLLIDAQSNVDGSVQDGWREPVRGSASSRV